MNKKNVATVNGKDNDDNDVMVVVKRPTPQQMTEGQIVASKAFNEAVKKKVIFRAGLIKSLKEQGLWSDSQQKELESFGRKINAGERQLKAGGRTPDGKPFTKTDARKLAISMREWRTEQLLLLARTRANDEYTVEGKSENAKFEYFMTNCILNEDEGQHFESESHYQLMANEEHPYIFDAASELANMVSNFDVDYEKKLPENKFLCEYGFAREDGRLINADEKLIDEDGNIIDEEGRYLNADGDFVDIEGSRVDDEGNPVEEFTPFAEEPAKAGKKKKSPAIAGK